MGQLFGGGDTSGLSGVAGGLSALLGGSNMTDPLGLGGGADFFGLDPTGSAGATAAMMPGGQDGQDVSGLGGAQAAPQVPQAPPEAPQQQAAAPPQAPPAPVDPQSWQIGGGGQAQGPTGFTREDPNQSVIPREANRGLNVSGAGMSDPNREVAARYGQFQPPSATPQPPGPSVASTAAGARAVPPAMPAQTPPEQPPEAGGGGPQQDTGQPGPSPQAPVGLPRGMPGGMPQMGGMGGLGGLIQNFAGAMQGNPQSILGLVQQLVGMAGGGGMGQMGGMMGGRGMPPWMPGYGPGMRLRPQDQGNVQQMIQHYRQTGELPRAGQMPGQRHGESYEDFRQRQQQQPQQPGARPTMPPYAVAGQPHRAFGGQPPPQTSISPVGTTFIAQHEGFVPRAQWDYRQWTNGYGTRAAYAGEVIGREEAARRLTVEVNHAHDAVDRVVPRDAPQNVRDALTSFSFNVGTRWTRDSALADACRNGEWDRAARIMQSYNRAGGQVNSGLVNRRRAEAQLMMGPPQPAQQPVQQPQSPFGDPRITALPQRLGLTQGGFAPQWEAADRFPSSLEFAPTGSLYPNFRRAPIEDRRNEATPFSTNPIQTIINDTPPNEGEPDSALGRQLGSGLQ